MVITMKNLIGTGIRKGDYNVEFTMVWNDPDDSAATFRKIQADTYRVAAAVAEGSVGDRWCLNVDAGCSYIGGTRKATVIKIELAEGDAGEMARAEALLRKVAQDIKN